MVALEKAGSPPSDAELKPYLDFLIRKELIELAYNAWLQMLPRDDLASVRHLNNGDFSRPVSGLPFDWQIGSQLNAVAEIVDLPASQTGRALHIQFGSGRVMVPEVRQITTLAPGRYSIKIDYKGNIVAKRGLRWEIGCLYGKRHVLAQSRMLVGDIADWQSLEQTFEVPDTSCKAQVVRAFHDARSASEQLISGEVWFRRITLERVNNLASSPQ
jgi:hypothetical protein